MMRFETSRSGRSTIALAALLACAGCGPTPPAEAVYTARKHGTEQRFTLRPDGVFIFQGPGGETRGRYTNAGDGIDIVTDGGIHTSLAADDDDLVDEGGFRWTKQE
jgi:hypothetical protein